MDIKIGIRDRRQSGWYRVDNEVYDIPMSCEALAVYNAVARFANNQTEKAYFSGKKWKKHHKVGNGKLSKGIRELISHNLIRPTGEVTNVGAPYYELCNIDHLKTLSQGGTGGCSEAEQGGVLRRNTNKTKTNNKDKESHADAWTPPPFKDTKTAKKKPISMHPEYSTARALMIELDNNFMETKTLREQSSRALKKHGLADVLSAIRGRAVANFGKDKWWAYLFSDDVAFQACIDKDKAESKKVLDMRERFSPQARETTAEEREELEKALSAL